jgi:hypothetical protein
MSVEIVPNPAYHHTALKTNSDFFCRVPFRDWYKLKRRLNLLVSSIDPAYPPVAQGRHTLWDRGPVLRCSANIIHIAICVAPSILKVLYLYHACKAFPVSDEPTLGSSVLASSGVVLDETVVHLSHHTSWLWSLMPLLTMSPSSRS